MYRTKDSGQREQFNTLIDEGLSIEEARDRVGF